MPPCKQRARTAVGPGSRHDRELIDDATVRNLSLDELRCLAETTGKFVTVEQLAKKFDDYDDEVTSVISALLDCARPQSICFRLAHEIDAFFWPGFVWRELLDPEAFEFFDDD